ncbi:MAG: hypothetical protein NT172_08030 [Planctomycetota bacterium]|nr:hypothetical protein [Planctomycetota bacterium]
MASHDDLKKPGTQGRILEYAEFIEDQVARARSRIKSNDMFRASLWIVTVSIGVLFLEVILDHTLELPAMARRLVLYGGLGAGSIYAFLRIARPMLMRVNTLYAAKSIESTDSVFKNSLINYLQIRDDPNHVAPSVLAQIEARAVADLSKVNVDNVVDQSPLTRLSYALAAIVVSICLYSWITPKSLMDSARRAFLADVQRPTNTRFLNITPGDKPDAPKAVTGMPVSFTVETLGAQPESVTLFTSRDNGKTFAETVMTQGRSFADPWEARIDRVPGELFYYMAGGDGRTKTYRLDVLPVAIVEKVALDYDFPEYAHAPRREAVEEGNVEALQGTRITLTATTNQPARSGLLDFGQRPPVPLVPVQGDQRKLTGSFLVDTDGQYSVKFNTIDGQTNPEPVLYDIRVVKDVAPTARFIRPESPTLRPANARVPLVIEASDDFGLKEVKLHVHKGSEILQKAIDLIDPQSKEVSKILQKTVALDLEPLSLKVGDKIEYWLSLRDNCDLQPNKFETPRQTIEIQDPVSQPKREELAQNEMAQAREETGEQNPMDQPNQSDKPQDGSNPQNEQQNQGNQKQGDQKQGQSKQPEDQKKEGQGNKNTQGDETQEADPTNNASPAANKAQGKQQKKSSPASKADQQNQNAQQNPAGETGETENQTPDASQKDSPKQKGGNTSASKSGNPKEKSNQKSSPMNKSGEQSETGTEQAETDKAQENGLNEPSDQPKKTAGNEKSGSAKSKNQQKNASKTTGDKNQTSGQESSDSQEKKSVDNKNSLKSKEEETSDSAESQKTPGATEKKPSDDKSKSGNDQKQTDDQKKGQNKLPQGGPKAEDGSDKTGEKQSSKDFSDQDREKLNKIRKALGLNDPPQEAEENVQKKSGPNESGQKKELDKSHSGDQPKNDPKAGQENDTTKSTLGQDKQQADSKKAQPKVKSGDQPKDATKSAQENDQPNDKSGDKPKSDGESEKSQSKDSPQPTDKKGEEQGAPGKEGLENEKGESKKGEGKNEKGESEKGEGKGEKGESEKGEGKGEKGESEKGEGKGEKGESEKGEGKGEKGESVKGEVKGEKGESEKGEGKGEKGETEKGEGKGEKGKSEKGEGKGEKGESEKGEGKGEKGESEKGEGKGEKGESEKGEVKGEKGDSEKGEGEKGDGKSEENGKPGPLTNAQPKSGGMRKGTDTPAAKPDQSTPSPRALEPDQPEPNDNLSPEQKADQRLLKRLRDMVDKNEISKDLENATGLSREEINQFVRKFEPPALEERKSAEGAGSSEVKSAPGKETETRNVTLPSNLPGGKVTSRTGRGAGMVADDSQQGNLEGARSRIPSGLRSRFEAYQKGLSRTNSRGAGTTNSGESRPTNKSGSEPGSGSDR